MFNVQSHLPLFGEILRVKSSNFYWNPNNLEFCIRRKISPHRFRFFYFFLFFLFLSVRNAVNSQKAAWYKIDFFAVT